MEPPTAVPDFLSVSEFVEWPPAGRYHDRWHLLDSRPVQMPTLTHEQAVLLRRVSLAISVPLRHMEAGARVAFMPALNLAGSDRDIYVAAIGVTCEPAGITRLTHKPVVIAEVINPENHKFVHAGVALCKRFPGLQEIVVLDGLHVCAAIHRRTARGAWDEPDHVFADEDLALRSLGLTVPLNRLYSGLDLDAQQQEADTRDDYWTAPA